MSNHDPTTTRLQLAQQAEEIIDEGTTTIDLVSELDVSVYAHEDPYSDWHDSASFDPMFRAILVQAIEAYTDTEIHRKVAEDAEVAKALGFSPGGVPARCTFNRARTDRFEGLESRIETTARQIREVADGCGSPIGPSLSIEGRTGTSERTRNRLIRGKTAEVVEEMERIVFPALQLPRPENPIYDEEELLLFETLLGLDENAANEGSEAFAEIRNPEGKTGEDVPFYEDGPSGETVLEAIKELNAEAITDMVNRACARILARVTPYVEFESPVLLAIDMTYVAYYGERDGMVKLQGAPEDKEYNWCHKFATVNIVEENVHFTVGMLPVGDAHYHDPDAYAGQDKSYRVGDIVRNLLDIAENHVNVRSVYADREFYAGDAVAAFEEYSVKYVIPARKTSRVSQFLDTMEGRVKVEEEYAFYSALKGGVSNERITTTLVGLPPDEDWDSPQPFITNSEVDDEIGLDRRRTKRKIKRYNKRGGIETSYKKTKEFAAWTTSREHDVRLFHFGFGVLLYNMWLLVDFLVQVSLDSVEFRPKPRVTADQFRRHLRRRLDRLI